MDHLLSGFAAELVKLAATRAINREDAALRSLYRDVKKKSQMGSTSGLNKLRGRGRQVSRDYLASSLIGAAATPMALLLGSKISRSLHNREVRRAFKGLRGKRRRTIKAHLEKGPVLGRSALTRRGRKPMMTHAELAGHAARGGAMGSVIQMLRDRFSGSAGAGDRARTRARRKL